MEMTRQNDKSQKTPFLPVQYRFSLIKSTINNKL